MSQFDIAAIDSRTESKVTAKPQAERKPCKSEGCQNPSAPRSMGFCVAHKAEYDALKAERYINYRNAVRIAGTAANAVESDDSQEVFVHLSDARNGFAYFAKEALPNFFVAPKSKKNPEGHTYGGAILKVSGTKAARAFAEGLVESGLPADEGFSVSLLTITTIG